MRAIRNLEVLRESLEDGHTEFVIQLNFGAISRKSIFPRSDGGFSVFNGIDGKFRELSAEELSEDIIGEAMAAGAFFEEG
jgi:hypothetical protein